MFSYFLKFLPTTTHKVSCIDNNENLNNCFIPKCSNVSNNMICESCLDIKDRNSALYIYINNAIKYDKDSLQQFFKYYPQKGNNYRTVNQETKFQMNLCRVYGCSNIIDNMSVCDTCYENKGTIKDLIEYFTV